MTMPLSGYATFQGTEAYRDRFKHDAGVNHFRNEQNLWLSSIGIGTYLGDANDTTDQKYTEAVVRAVELGVNVIDTAANYRFQRSERSIEKALQVLSHEGCSREGLVICTKGGYLPFDGAPPADVRRYTEETFVRSGIATFADFVGGSHSMAPTYLQHQLEQSLRNMGLSSVDVYYIHNPESQLGVLSRDEFYSRLQAAFELLEKKISEGKIKMYGLATWNGFRVPEGAREHHSLPRMVDLAREIGGEQHGFRFIQLPYNLGMTEAFTLQNQSINGEKLTVLEAASALGITVVASASILQGRVARGLPEDLRESLGALATDAQTAIQFVRSTPGITTALIGMSSREHVEDNLQLRRIEPLPPHEFLELFER